MNIVEWKGNMYAHIWDKWPKCMSLTWDELKEIIENKDKIEAVIKLLSDWKNILEKWSDVIQNYV